MFYALALLSTHQIRVAKYLVSALAIRVSYPVEVKNKAIENARGGKSVFEATTRSAKKVQENA